jgi:hypothetical protein
MGRRLRGLWLLLAAVALGARADTAGEPLVLERLKNRYHFEASGEARFEAFARIRVQNEAGVQQLGQLLFPFIESRETLSLSLLRVLDGEGTVKHDSAALVQKLPAPVTSVFPLYSDLQILHVTVPSFRAGDVVEYGVSTHIHTPDAPGDFWMSHEFQWQTLVEEELLEIRFPSDLEVRMRQPAKLGGHAEETDGETVWTWRHSNLQRETEDPEPGDWDLELSSFGSWDEVGRWYQRLRGERERPDEAVAARAAELVDARRRLDRALSHAARPRRRDERGGRTRRPWPQLRPAR